MIRIQEFFDKTTFTLTYVVWDEKTRDAVVIDPVLDYDQASSTVSEDSVAKLNAFIDKENLTPHYILETHAHADHLSGSQALKARSMGATDASVISPPFFSRYVRIVIRIARARARSSCTPPS